MQLWLLIPWFTLGPWRLPLPWGGTLTIHAFGILVAIAIVVGNHFAHVRARQLGLAKEVIRDFVTWTTVFGLVSAYVLNIVMYSPETLPEIARDPSLLLRWSGLSSYGGFFGGAVAAFVFARRRGVSLVSLGDAWCYAIPFAWFFARLGCFVVHDHPGRVSDFWLAVDDYRRLGRPRHDLGLYEVLWSVPVAGWFLLLNRRPRPAGVYLALTPLLYGPVRFALDFLRAAPSDGGDARYAGFTPGQYGSLLVSVIGFGLLFQRLRSRARHSASRRPVP